MKTTTVIKEEAMVVFTYATKLKIPETYKEAVNDLIKEVVKHTRQNQA